MKARTFAPRKLDIGAFIESAELMTGSAPVAELPRVAVGLAKDIDLTTLAPIDWSAHGRLVPQRIGGPQMWLDLSVNAHLAWECQRCLQAVTLPVVVERSIRFAKDEAAAAELDADSDDDVLALSRQFDLMALVEDELIMAQPIVPRHEICPSDIVKLMHSDEAVSAPGQAAPAGSPGEETAASGRPNPFAVLASLKKDKS